MINETLGTLNTALVDEILVTIIVVIIMLMHLRSSVLISGLLPLTVLIVFIAMKLFKVDANIVALSGIAIAIGTIVDMGIVMCENILKHLDNAPPGANKLQVIYNASSEVGSAILTAIATTVVSFLPVFAMEAAEGKLFKPLAYTKTFALLASVVVALTIIPPFAHILFSKGKKVSKGFNWLPVGLILSGIIVLFLSYWLTGTALIVLAAYLQFKNRIPSKISVKIPVYFNYLIVLVVAAFLSDHWLPLGVQAGEILNYIFVVVLLGSVLFLFQLLIKVYDPMLRWCLDNKKLFLSIPVVVIVIGMSMWLGFNKMFGFIPGWMQSNAVYSSLSHTFPGIGKSLCLI